MTNKTETCLKCGFYEDQHPHGTDDPNGINCKKFTPQNHSQEPDRVAVDNPDNTPQTKPQETGTHNSRSVKDKPAEINQLKKIKEDFVKDWKEKTSTLFDKIVSWADSDYEYADTHLGCKIEDIKQTNKKILERIDEPLCFCGRNKDFTGICRECLINERVIGDTLRPDKRKRLIDGKVIKFILDTLHSFKEVNREKIKEIIKSEMGKELMG